MSSIHSPIPSSIPPFTDNDPFFSKDSSHAESLPKEGRNYTRLNSIERISRLAKIISVLMAKLITLDFNSAETKRTIQKWWEEFKTGQKKINSFPIRPPKPPVKPSVVTSDNDDEETPFDDTLSEDPPFDDTSFEEPLEIPFEEETPPQSPIAIPLVVTPPQSPVKNSPITIPKEFPNNDQGQAAAAIADLVQNILIKPDTITDPIIADPITIIIEDDAEKVVDDPTLLSSKIDIPKLEEKLNLVIDLGHQILENPNAAFNKYIDMKEGLQLTTIPPDSSAEIHDFLKNIEDFLTIKTCSADQLLALEAFTSLALYSYIINPQTKLDSDFQPITDTLCVIRTTVNAKLNTDAMKDQVAELRKSDQNQVFYKFIKEKLENTPHYPKNFWLDPRAIEKMQIAKDLLSVIGLKIASPDKNLNDPTQLIYKNEKIGYELYFYPPESENEKPKLLLFLTKNSSYALLQGMNHQLGLFGDPTILGSAQEVLSNIISTDILEGYQQDLQEGNIEIIASGFDNCGSAATIVANRMAMLYPKTRVTSIAAGSTAVVTTEEAYNMLKAVNFFPIRLKYINDTNVDRQNMTGDFSNDLYHTFPLLVRYNLSTADIYKHNKEEYGNRDNFIPAMTYPLVLRNLYDVLTNNIHYNVPQRTPEEEIDLTGSLVSSMLGSMIAIPQQHLFQAGRIDDLIALGDQMRLNLKNYNDAFLKLEKDKLSSSHKAAQLSALEKAQAQALKKDREAIAKAETTAQITSLISACNPLNWYWFDKSKSKTTAPNIQKSLLTLEELENTITALQQSVIYLKNPNIRDHLNAEQAFSLLIAVDTLLINYTKINGNVGKMPQLIDLITEMRDLALGRLKVLYQEDDQKENISKLMKNDGANFEHLANRAVTLNPYYKNLFEKRDVLEIIDFEDRFLEFIGFKIAAKGEDKIGSEAYTSLLHNDTTLNYDISLFTPEDSNKKQRIVICCNGNDALGTHGLLGGTFGAGDVAIIERAEKLKAAVISQLKEQFKKHQFNANDVEIVVTGFGSEGAVATALGLFLAKQYEPQKCQVRSFGFGAPKFTTPEGANTIQKQKNFIPIRFLSSSDTRFEWKLSTIGDYPLSDQTYYTIPFQFRIVGTLELGGHNTNLYGDVQAIKTSMRTAYQMREVANERKNLKSLANDTDILPKDLPKRILIDSKHVELSDLSNKSVDELKQALPGKLIRSMKYCLELSENKSISEEDKIIIKKFFSTFIEAIKNEDINEKHPIENNFYKEMVNHGYRPHQLFSGKWKFQQIISEDLAKAMADVTNAEANLDPKIKEELILRRSFYRGILAGDLNGNRYKPAGGGVNGAVFFRHLESGFNTPDTLLPEEKHHQPFLGVFKPHPETVRAFKGWFDATQWGERIKAVAGMDAHLNKQDPDNRVHNEIFAYELFHIFGFNAFIGFPTTLQFINKNDCKQRPASFCAFIPGFDIVGLHIKNLDTQKRRYTPNELFIWQISKIFDYLTGNMDGHEGNAFVKIENGRVVGAVNFDYDKAFAIEKTKNIGNQYKWAQLRISKNDFTEATKTALNEMLKDPDAESKIQAFLTKAREGAVDKQHFTEAQEKLLRERIAILKEVAQGKVKQLADLACYK